MPNQPLTLESELSVRIAGDAQHARDVPLFVTISAKQANRVCGFDAPIPGCVDVMVLQRVQAQPSGPDQRRATCPAAHLVSALHGSVDLAARLKRGLEPLGFQHGASVGRLEQSPKGSRHVG
jgi:hypothetical protein